MDVEDVLVLLLVDDRPFLDRAKRDALVHTIGIEFLAADQEGELLVVRGGRKLGLIGR